MAVAIDVFETSRGKVLQTLVNDKLFLDADDMSAITDETKTFEWIDGGDGYDQARTDDSGTDGVTLNMGTTRLERFRGGGDDDLIDAS